MAVNYSELIKGLEAEKHFKDWKKNCPQSYLVHIFVMLDEANKGLYQIGYLNPKSDQITTFVFGNGRLELNPESEILKEPETTIFPLEMKNVKLDEAKMLSAVNEFIRKNYPKAIELKKFYILQHIDIGQIFNFTVLTSDFKTLNVKMDSASGEILRHSLQELMHIG